MECKFVLGNIGILRISGDRDGWIHKAGDLTNQRIELHGYDGGGWNSVQVCSDRGGFGRKGKCVFGFGVCNRAVMLHGRL